MFHHFGHGLTDASIKVHEVLQLVSGCHDFGRRLSFAFSPDHLKLGLHTLLYLEQTKWRPDNRWQKLLLQTSPTFTSSPERWGATVVGLR